MLDQLHPAAHYQFLALAAVMNTVFGCMERAALQWVVISRLMVKMPVAILVSISMVEKSLDQLPAIFL